MQALQPDLQGKVCLVTGATAGIGKVTALALARQGATVVIVGRNPGKTADAASEISRVTGNKQIEFLVADLSVMSDVRRLAGEFRERHDRLHVLINNAGGIFNPRAVTADGFEMTFALNHLAYYLLTNLLIDLLKASAPARVVSLSSDAHRAGTIDFADLMSERGYRPMRAYAQSKLANILFTYELARRLEGTGVTANCVHPGVVATDFGRSWRGWGWIWRVLGPLLLTPEKGAETTIYLASAPELESVSGDYFIRKTPVKSVPESYRKDVALRLWQVSSELTGADNTTPGV